MIPGHGKARDMIADRTRECGGDGAVIEHLVVGAHHTIVIVGTEFESHTPAQHVTALSLAFQQTHPGLLVIPTHATRLFFLCFEIGLDLPVKGAAQTVESIDALHGFHDTCI